jgi:glycosyltransferase involved in cell wall biosynthesis
LEHGVPSLKVLHILPGLEQGGAEGVLYRLALATRGEMHHTVISMTGEGIYGPRLRSLGIPVHTLDLGGWRSAEGLYRLWRVIQGAGANVVQTWLYKADLIGGSIARLAGVRAICWGIRNSNFNTCGRSNKFAGRICAKLSGTVPSAIISCSELAAEVHQSLGYRASKFTVIPNGYDLSLYFPQKHFRETLRNEWGVPAQTPLLGTVGRWNPQKDYANLLAALSLLAKNGQDFRCILAGTGMERSNAALWKLISSNGLEENVILLGPRNDIPYVMNALDVHVLSSFREAFPNVVAEAMACGTPCVTTDVGDAALIVGDTGWIVPPSDAPALASGIKQALSAIQSTERGKISQACRERIAERFSIERMVTAYKEIWSKCAGVSLEVS